MKTLCVLVGMMILCISIEGQTDTVTTRLVLIGDAGQLTNGRHPVVDAVRNLIKLDEKTSIIYLGDNLYKTGLPDEKYSYYMASRSVLDTQLSVADNTPA